MADKTKVRSLGVSVACGVTLVFIIVPAESRAAADNAAQRVSEKHGQEGPGRPPNYTIVVTGGELLEGAYADGHTLFLTRTLRPLGLRCVGSMIVDDHPEDIKRALNIASDKSRLVIVTGGLGPTPNDVTRETLSDFTGIKLQEHADVLAEMERRFKTPRDQLRPNLRRQTQVPTRGTYLKNANGTSIGLIFEPAPHVGVPAAGVPTSAGVGASASAAATIVALPGPPRELQPMVRDELVPYLTRRFGTRAPGCSLTLRFVGLGQSQIDQTLKQHVPLPPDVIVYSAFDGSRVDFTFSLAEDTPQCRARLQELKRAIQEQLGEQIYAEGETTLEDRIAELLTAKGQTLILAEVGSGGRLAAGLTGAERGGRVLKAAFVAPSEDQLRQMLRVADDRWKASTSSLQRTEQIAAAAAEMASGAWAIAVGEPEKDARGEGRVRVVFRSPAGRIESAELAMRGSGELVRSNLVTQVLDQFRRRLSGPQAAGTDVK